MSTESNEQRSIENLHSDHNEWKNEIALQKDEIKSFENRLAESVNKNTNKEWLAQAEHIQNSYIRHKEVISEINHQIDREEAVISKLAKENIDNVDKVKYPDHFNLRDKVETQKKLFAELKQESNEFFNKTF